VAQFPPLTVEPPPVDAQTPAGLFTVARLLQGPDLPGNDDRWEAGVQYQIQTCAKVSGWAETCPPEAPEDKTFDLRFPTVVGTPFVAYLGIDCPLVGYSLDEFETAVRNGFLANENRLVEEAFWSGRFGNSPSLAGTVADPSDCVNLTPGDPEGTYSGGTATTIVGGIAALEDYLGANYGGVGIIHAPRGVAPFAARDMQVERSGSRLTTTLGTRWAFGGGYTINTGPDGVVAPAGEAWLYATGAVTIYRSDVWVNPNELRAAFDTRTNQVEILAERKYVITRECVCAAIRVRIGCSC